MKLIWYSVSPYCPTGYGTVTKHIVPRLMEENECLIATKHLHAGSVPWKGTRIIDGTDMNALNRRVEKEGFDFVITLFDAHSPMTYPKNWIAYTPFDSMEVPESIAESLPHMKYIIALTEHGKKSFEGLGYKAAYIPHGVDPKVFYPDEEARQESRKVNHYTDSNFVISFVGINYSDGRKGLVELLEAFATFHELHSDARLFLSSTANDPESRVFLPDVIKSLQIEEVVGLQNQDMYYNGEIEDEHIANVYRMSDVFILPTRGEGFGLPLIEAQACGTPIITTNASTGPELIRGGWLIELGQYDWEWFAKAWRPRCNPIQILDCLEKAYSSWKKGELRQIGINASQKIIEEYNWDTVWEKYWKPFLEAVQITSGK